MILRGVPVLLLLAAACMPGAERIVFQGTEDALRDRQTSRLGVELVPELPEALVAGDSLRVEATPFLATGRACPQCRVRWSEHASGPARWVASEPPCALGRCATLLAHAPGEVELWLDVCPGVYEGCTRHHVRIRVVGR